MLARSAAALLAALAFLCSSALDVRAQPGASDAEKRQRAGEHVEKGDRFKEAGEYEKAALEYEKAYELVPHPLLFFNLAQVYRLGGDDEKALDYYQRYLDAEPDGRAAPQAREQVEKLRAQIEARKKPKDGDEPRGDLPRWLRIGGMASAGVGVVLFGLAVKFGLDAKAASDDLSQHDGPWSQEALSRQGDGKRAQSRMYISAGFGAAALAGGAVLYYFGYTMGRRSERAEEPRVTAQPVVTDRELGLTLSGRF